MVVRDIERSDVEFIAKTLACVPVAHIDALKSERLGSVALVEEVRSKSPDLTLPTVRWRFRWHATGCFVAVFEARVCLKQRVNE
jgi:hypothetical protein